MCGWERGTGGEGWRGRRCSGRPNPHSSRFDCNQRTLGQLGAIAIKDLSACGALLPRLETDQANDSRVFDSPDHNQLPKIFVEGHQYGSLAPGAIQDFEVSGVVRPISCPFGFMAGIP